MSAAQAAAAFNPSLVGYFGNNGLSSLGKVALGLGDDMERAKYRAATLKLQQDEADGKAQYYRDMAETKRMAIEQKAKDMAVEQAKGEANIAAIKANNPDFANAFVMNSAKGAEYLDPNNRSNLERGLAYVKLGDVKDKQPNLQHIQLKGGEIGVFNPATGEVKGAGIKGDYTDPYGLASFKAELALGNDEQRPIAKSSGEKMAKVSDYMNKGYAAQGLTGDPVKDKIIKSYSFGSIDGKYLIPPTQINAFKKDMGL